MLDEYHGEINVIVKVLLDSFMVFGDYWVLFMDL
jgi:hypothetical protein